MHRWFSPHTQAGFVRPSCQSYTCHGMNVVLSLWPLLGLIAATGLAVPTPHLVRHGGLLWTGILRQAALSNARLSVMSLLIVFSQQTNYLFLLWEDFHPSVHFLSMLPLLHLRWWRWWSISPQSWSKDRLHPGQISSWLQGRYRNKQPHTITHMTN